MDMTTARQGAIGRIVAARSRRGHGPCPFVPSGPVARCLASRVDPGLPSAPRDACSRPTAVLGRLHPRGHQRLMGNRNHTSPAREASGSGERIRIVRHGRRQLRRGHGFNVNDFDVNDVDAAPWRQGSLVRCPHGTAARGSREVWDMPDHYRLNRIPTSVACPGASTVRLRSCPRCRRCEMNTGLG
jgi:hypothetical protein